MHSQSDVNFITTKLRKILLNYNKYKIKMYFLSHLVTLLILSRLEHWLVCLFFHRAWYNIKLTVGLKQDVYEMSGMKGELLSA